jgi:beta-glucanase (GH16 family)
MPTGQTGLNLVLALIGLCLFSLSARADTQGGKVEAGAPLTLAGCKILAVPGEDYKLVWNDEFNTGKLDAGRWSIGLPWKGSEDGHWHTDGYASYITDEDVSVGDGNLHLTCRKKDIQGKTRAFHYTEGFVTTSGKYEFTYGYAEARCKAPMDAGAGMWPAFWTLSGTGEWPPEFDVIEIWTGEPRLHQGYASKKPGGGAAWKSFHKKGIKLDGYHTFGMEWGPGYVFFNIDGSVNNRVFGDVVTSKAQYLILNSAVCSGKGNIGPDEKSIFPNSFDVDYCRVYQRELLTPILHNGNFQFETLAPWKSGKKVSLADGHSHDGTRSMRIDPGGSSEQKLFGLKPATTYTLSAWISGEQKGGSLGVRDYGGKDVHDSTGTGEMTFAQIKFTTGEAATSAVVYCENAANAGAAFFSNVELKP